MSTLESTTATLPIDAIRRSPTNPRKRFPETAHAEMTASVRKHGILQPLLVRPWPDEPGLFELVAGERRHRAAETACLVEVPVLVRDMTDDEVLHIQIIENLQRKDLHPLEEADGYKILSDRGHTLEQIADEVSQTKTYVAQRLKLCALNASTRKLFFEEKLNAKTALMIARLPTDLQDTAAKRVATGWAGEPMSAKQASDYVQRDFMLRLDQAPFKTADAQLVPVAGACGPCPKRTGNQAELFDDVKGKEICTDPACYARKSEAAAKQKRAAAEAAGRTVIAGKEAKQVKPHQYGSLMGGWVNLDERCYDDSKSRTYRQILGKGVNAAALLEDPHDRKLVDVMQKSDLKKALADKGINARSAGTAVPRQSADNAKKKAEDAYRGELFRQIRAKHEGTGLDDFDLKIVAIAFYRRLWNENQKRVTKLYEWGSKPLTEAEFAKKVDAFVESDSEALGRLVMDIALIDESVSATYSTGKPALLEATAHVRGIDPAIVKKQVAEIVKSKAKPAVSKSSPAKKAAVKRATPAKKAPAKSRAAATPTTQVEPSNHATPKLKPGLDPAAAWPFPNSAR